MNIYVCLGYISEYNKHPCYIRVYIVAGNVGNKKY